MPVYVWHRGRSTHIAPVAADAWTPGTVLDQPALCGQPAPAQWMDAWVADADADLCAGCARVAAEGEA